MEAKPICLVYVPDDLGTGRKSNWRDCNDLTEQYLKEKPDYYWFFIPDHNAERIEFKVFNEKYFTKIQYSELKALIEKSINEIKTNTPL
jgi:hypothetical protein